MPDQTSHAQPASHSPAASAAHEPAKVGLLHHLYASVAATLVLAVICCGFYPAIVWGIAQLPGLKWKANGSLLTDKQGTVVGSALLAQPFHADKYFHERPSAAGNGTPPDNTQLSEYNAAGSGATNYGPTSATLITGSHSDPNNVTEGIVDLANDYRGAEGLTPADPVPADAVTRSGSGLDPHISVMNATIQANRVARVRHIDPKKVIEYVQKYTEGPDLGIFGGAGVNVLRLNLALDTDFPAK